MNATNESSLRPLNIDFDQYTDGDIEFKNELVSLMIIDLRDLQKSLVLATQSNNPEIYLKACHKARTTVVILNDPELILVLEELKLQVPENQSNNVVFLENISLFNRLCEGLVKNLSDLNL